MVAKLGEAPLHGRVPGPRFFADIPIVCLTTGYAEPNREVTRCFACAEWDKAPPDLSISFGGAVDYHRFDRICGASVGARGRIPVWGRFCVINSGFFFGVRVFWGN